jgi:hypothetical protein
MPHYDYRCVNAECDFVATDVHLPIDGRDFPTTEPCPKCQGAIERLIAGPGVSYTVIPKKVPDTFKDLLRNIKSKHRGSTIDV